MPSIVFESIGDEYCWGNYAEFRVLIMRENGYINATKLCKDGGKSFKHWNDNQESNDLIKELASSAGIPTELISIKNMKGSYELRGTYVHRDLVPNIASWISPSFSLKVSRIVNEYLLMKENLSVRRLLPLDLLIIYQLRKWMDLMSIAVHVHRKLSTFFGKKRNKVKGLPPAGANPTPERCEY